jgi:hypothetical protein
MIRKAWWSALVIAIAAMGCGNETPDTEVNNTIPQTQNNTPPADQGGGNAPASEGQVKGPMGGAPASASYPSDYPGMKKAAGEGEKKDGEKKDGEKKDGESKEGEKKDEAPKTASISLSEDEITQIKKLPEADQKLALAQAICLVNEEEGKPVHLGAMGKPFKTEVNGQTVFLCCKGCEGDLKKDPAKFLAKLGK